MRCTKSDDSEEDIGKQCDETKTMGRKAEQMDGMTVIPIYLVRPYSHRGRFAAYGSAASHKQHFLLWIEVSVRCEGVYQTNFAAFNSKWPATYLPSKTLLRQKLRAAREKPTARGNGCGIGAGVWLLVLIRQIEDRRCRPRMQQQVAAPRV